MTFLHLFHHASITVIVGSLLPLDYGASDLDVNANAPPGALVVTTVRPSHHRLRKI